MIDFDLYEGVRGVLVLLTAIVLCSFAYLFVKGYPRMSRAQKLFTSAVLCFIAAVGARAIEAVNDGDPFKWALIPYVTGLVLSFAYLALPKHEKAERLDQESVYSHEDIEIVRDQLRDALIRNEELRDHLYEMALRNNNLKLENYALKDTEVRNG